MIGKRYQVVTELGTSSTGVVYSAVDRLSGSRIALRIVTAPLFEPADDDGASKHRLALSRQLRLIASSHHPNIVGLIDYGFDDRMRPYYTQRLLEQPLGLLEAGRDQPFEARLDLLLQALQGLAYLHRRGVVHGDLRPRTVLVDDRRVQLVNYGLAALREAEAGSEAAYLAPEILAGEEASPESDLYALGILIYELLSGRPAGDGSGDPAGRRGRLEISTRDLDGRVIPVLEKLLAEKPGERYCDAAEVIVDLTRALDQPLPEETSAIRESFLQRARLAGREQHVERLAALVEAVLEGRGDALLVAGESGVGKSRLLEELRAMSLAAGALVISGRAVAEGYHPYHSWRLILRHLLLLVEVDDAEAAVLLHQVPGALSDRDIPPAPALDPQAARKEFVAVVQRLLGRLERPAVFILEDLHWAGTESLDLMSELARSAARLPLVLVGTFRDDERPDLAMMLAEIPQLKLGRLGREEILELTEAMLGRRDHQDELVDFLQRETGGNAFFLVEMMRALAEEAGRLDHIDPAHLPEQVTTGSIQQILKRRLERLPRRVRPLLQLAAVAGREVDLKLLGALDPNFQPRVWLRFCADQAVLEVDGGRWRFAGESFREALLDDLPVSELRGLHRRVAEAIAAVYGRAAESVAGLAYHWTRAADLSDPEATGLAVDYLERAGHAAMQSCAHTEALRLLNRGLELLGTLPPAARRQRQEIRFQLDLGGVWMMSKGYTAPQAGQAFGRALSLSRQIGESRHRMPALLGLWRFHIVRAELDTARDLAEEMRPLGEGSSRPSRRMLVEYVLGTTLLFRGELEPAARHLGAAIDLYSKLRADSRRALTASAFYLGQDPGVAALDYAGWANWCLGYPQHARALNRRAVALAEELGHPFSQAFACLLQAWQDQLGNDPEVAEASALAAIELSRDFPYFLTLSTIFHGWARARRGQAEEGLSQIDRALGALRAAGSELFRPHMLALQAEVYGLLSRSEEGLELLAAAIENADRCGSGYWKPELHRLRGDLYLSLSRPNRKSAESCFRQAAQLARDRAEKSLELRALISLVTLLGDQERATEPLAALEELYRSFSEGFDTPDLVAARGLLSIG